MGYAVAFSPSARRDLSNIVRFIAMDAPERARAFGRLLLDRTRRLGEFPELGRVVPEFQDESIRELIVGTYRIVYRVDVHERRIDVVRFWHAARGAPVVPSRAQ